MSSLHEAIYPLQTILNRSDNHQYLLTALRASWGVLEGMWGKYGRGITPNEI